MGPVSAQTAIDAPRERVFETITDLAVRPAFCDHFIEDYRLERIPARGEGAAARFRVGPPGGKTWMDTVLAELEPSHLVSERGHCGRANRVGTSLAWELLEGPGTVTTVRLTFWTTPSRRIDRLREPPLSAAWYRRKWSVALRRLKHWLESEEPMPRVGVAGADRVPSAAG